MRQKFTYRCEICKMENYIGSKNKQQHPDKMEIKKYCSKCMKHTKHVEKKRK